VTASNPTGNSNAATATVTVGGPTITLAPPTLPSGSTNVPYSQTITASGGTAPYTFAVTSGTLPSGLALSTQGVLSGTPKSVGTSTFTVTATDSPGRSGSQSYALSISNVTGTLQIVSGDKQVAPPSAPLPQSLVAKVVDSAGNPVVGAAVTWAVGQGAGTITSQTNTSNAQGLVQASYTTGPGQINNTVTATATGSGSSVTFTVLNEQINVTIPARQVIGPQGQAAFNAPIVQMNNVRQHLDQIRFASSPTVAEGLRLTYDGQALPPMSAFSVAPTDKDGKGQRQSGGGAAADKPDEFQRWGFFINGDVDIGRQSSVDTQTGFKATTHGVTAGVDYRFQGNSVLGAAVGYLKTDTNLDSGAGNQNAKGYSFSVYGTYVPVPNAYIDGIVNFGHNKYDGQRQAGADSFSNSTNGNQWGLAVSAGYAFNNGPLALTPYGRVEYVDAKVDGFTENGPAGALTIGSQQIKGTSLTLGGQASYAISTSWGVLIPNGRMEFQHLAQRSASNVSAQLVGVASPSVEIPILGDDRNFGNFAVGFSAIFQRGVSAFFNYQRLFGKNDFSDQLYTLGLRIEF
jgi:outer membrane autotransporter protein